MKYNVDPEDTSRRNLLLAMGAAAVAYGPMAAAKTGDAAPKHDHSKHSPQQGDLLEAVNSCLDKGQRCITHGLVMFQEGDTSVADCAAKVHEMQAICNGYGYLLASNSCHAKEMASLCKTVCTECAKECRKHEQHHECRACAEACEETIALLD